MSHKPHNSELPEPLDEAIEWLVKLRGEPLTETEMHDFADWLSRDLSHNEAFAQAEDFFKDMLVLTRQSLTNSKITLPEPKPRTRTALRTRQYWFLVPSVIAAIWLLSVGLILPPHAQPLIDLLSDYHTGTGETREVELSDGSKALLNTNTALSVNFSAGRRLVTLPHGQARFSVAQDKQRPFYVNCDSLRVRALGTIFEVYRKLSQEIDVTVQEHAVAVWLDQKQNSDASIQQVRAGHQLVYDASGILHSPEKINLSQNIAWQNRRLLINDRPLSELLSELERYRNGRIYLADSQLRQLRVTGVFPLEDPEVVLSSVRQILNLKETRLGKWWIILHR